MRWYFIVKVVSSFKWLFRWRTAFPTASKPLLLKEYATSDKYLLKIWLHTLLKNSTLWCNRYFPGVWCIFKIIIMLMDWGYLALGWIRNIFNWFLKKVFHFQDKNKGISRSKECYFKLVVYLMQFDVVFDFVILKVLPLFN